jgi:phosphoribosylanthranilate isomerase
LRVRVKICGITNLEDAEAVVRFGADAVGFIFYEKSPRFISPEKAGDIIDRLPPFITRVGVFVNSHKDLVMERIESLGLDRVQFHGEESPAFCQAFGKRAIKAIRIENADSLKVMEEYPVKTFLLDTYEKSVYGGTGQTFDWALAAKAKEYGNIILSGGLTPENVSDAIQTVSPYGVDVSGGVEISPGKKDHLRIRRFVDAVRERKECKDA